MIKKIYVIVAALTVSAGLAWAGRIMFALIGPSTATGRVQIAAAGAGIRNCLTDLDVISDANYTFRIIDGTISGTTVYAVTVSSGASIVRSWSQDTPLCGSANSMLELVVSDGNHNINYSGFTGQ